MMLHMARRPVGASASAGYGRFETLDALRGLAALAVVFWHWQHFYFDPAVARLPETVDNQSLPLFWLCWPLYRYGRWGVDLFFCISGFVFFYLYDEAIGQRKVGGWKFFVLRFSRLYPLHMVTLLAVAAVQAFYAQESGHFFIYQDNGIKAFAKQLALASNWAPWASFSFNGPIWSVSIEVLLYAMFFALARLRVTKPILLAGVAAFGAVVVSRFHHLLGPAVFQFFVGGLCWHCIRGGTRGNWSPAVCLAVAMAVALVDQVADQRVSFVEWTIKMLVFPGLILVLAWSEPLLKPVVRYMGWLGNISYSSYLIHFPLQLIFVAAAAGLGWKVDFSSPVALLIFGGVLITLSLLSFHCLEIPAQRAIRATLERHGSAIAGSGPPRPSRRLERIEN